MNLWALPLIYVFCFLKIVLINFVAQFLNLLVLSHNYIFEGRDSTVDDLKLLRNLVLLNHLASENIVWHQTRILLVLILEAPESILHPFIRTQLIVLSLVKQLLHNLLPLLFHVILFAVNVLEIRYRVIVIRVTGEVTSSSIYFINLLVNICDLALKLPWKALTFINGLAYNQLLQLLLLNPLAIILNALIHLIYLIFKHPCILFRPEVEDAQADGLSCLPRLLNVMHGHFVLVIEAEDAVHDNDQEGE